jgi:hypothetical protein
MAKYKTIKDLFEAVKAGKIDESDIQIILDNDQTSFYLLVDGDPDNDIELAEGGGYSDITELYQLLFPTADIQWC